ncbi:MAG: hypothetical protein M0C28_26930 [Candidatus Moduliflexus flocculans]|nr:hypothetical protein [Candidatus Moduliflexus flocculans]
MDGLRTELGQFSLLTRHFFGRMFRNETVDFEDQMKEKLIVSLALLAVFFFWASELMLFKYHFVPDIGRSWQEKNYIYTLMMLVFGVVTLLEWDVLFPDRRDFVNLTPLPVRLRTVFSAKLASFILFVALFSTAMMSLSSVLFSIYLDAVAGRERRSCPCAMSSPTSRRVSRPVSPSSSPSSSSRSCWPRSCPRDFTSRPSIFVRFALIAGLLFLLFSFVAAPSIVGRAFQDLDVLKESRHPFVFRFPPLWFVGLYEVLLGTRDAVFEAQARTAGLAVALAGAAFLGASALSYRRHVVQTLEVRKGRPAFYRVRDHVRRLIEAALFREPEERAVHGFFSATLEIEPASPDRRSCYYLAVGTALVSIVLAANRKSLRTLTPENGLFLVLPVLLASGRPGRGPGRRRPAGRARGRLDLPADRDGPDRPLRLRPQEDRRLRILRPDVLRCLRRPRRALGRPDGPPPRRFRAGRFVSVRRSDLFPLPEDPLRVLLGARKAEAPVHSRALAHRHPAGRDGAGRRSKGRSSPSLRAASSS